MIKNMLPTCIVIGCINSIHNQTIKYYKVPIENANICRQWYINTLREDLEPSNNHYICIEHFDEESFLQQNQQHNGLKLFNSNDNKNNQILKEDAVPSLFEIEVFQKMIQHQELVSNGNRSISNSIQGIDLQTINDLGSSIITTQQHHHQQQQQTLLENLLINDSNTSNKINRQQTNNNRNQKSEQVPRCSIKTCVNSSNVSSSHGNGNDLILYSLPKVTDIAKKWMTACHLHDNDIKLCREHFLQSDFNEYNYLKPDAIPSVFINNNTRNNNKSHNINNNDIIIDNNVNLSKRARMDPEQRAELLARIPKAVKRTTIQQPQINNSINNSINNINNINININNNKIQKALKHTNSIMNKPAVVVNDQQQINSINSNSKFLSAALNNSQTIISPLKISPIISNKQQLNVNNNKAQKAVKHTTAASLLKDILPPPIMQSTKRTPRAVKHTNSIINHHNQAINNNSIIITAPATAPLYNQKIKTIATPTTNVTSNSSIVINSTNKNDLLINNQTYNELNVTTTNNGCNITQKTTYVYKKITQQPEIELYLECEDDESTDDAIKQQQISTSIVSIDKTRLNSPSQISNNNSSRLKEKVNINMNSPLNAKPIGNILNTNLSQHKLTSRQQQLQLHKVNQQLLPAEKRYIQVLLKYYSRLDDTRMIITNKNDSKKVNYQSKCNLCDKYLGNNIDFISHICSHLEGDNYVSPFEAVCTTCSVCESNFKNPFDLIIHLDTEHLTELNEFKCRICERQHKNLNELLAHLNTLHTINEMPYHCDVCSFRTSFYADAIYHIKTLHKDTLYNFCPYCLKSVLLPYGDKVQHVIVNNFYSHLITHFNKHENNELIESKCKHCRKCILHVRLMKEHLNNDHNTNSIISSPQTTNTDIDEGLFLSLF